ncbi:alpha-(1,3)-fucosyltransferase C-like [Ruditapes philippinarum]|uniref:alpha-(1,3)-fucosyltransferase C-like n=1 Tax=Ruditapes philippinarum TaxID=129788 RepID=UPI00295A7D23|nr:alpha-(1,3)-fucosyltransferase C-like [Ruditapes philippinarum]
MRIKGKKDAIYNDCECTNCIISQNRSKLMIADAVIFYIGIRNERMGEYPPINASNRNPNQAWIFTSVEPPEHYYNSDYMSPLWQSTMNWSCLYRLDSDIPNPYGFLIPSSGVDMIDYNTIYDKKTRNALWMVSHCQVASARRQFVLEMIRNGFNVDIFGGCSSNGRKIDTRELKQIIPLYKFVLAFENSLCTDYISEKYFNNYNSSWIIVVRGGADYNRLLPTDTYINTSDFKDISTLVNFLSKLGNDRLRYINYLKIKSKYVSIRWPGNKHCEICRRLNNLKQYRKSYADLNLYLNNQCYRPYDLD